MTRRSTHLLRLCVPCLLLAGAAAAPLTAGPVPARAQAPSEFETYRARFEGDWEATASAAENRRVVSRAIEETVAAMNYFVRAIARSQLTENTPLNQRITLQFLSGNRVRVHFSGTGWETTSRIGRTGHARSTDGADMRVTQRFRDGALEQVFETDAGTRWNTYHGTGDGTLRLDAVTQGMMMPQPMRFSMTYRRR